MPKDIGFIENEENSSTRPGSS